MENSQRRDPEYGYPSLDDTIGFADETACSSIEILRRNSDGAEQGDKSHEYSERTLDDQTFVRWLSTRQPEISVGGLRLILGTCNYDIENNSRILPFRRAAFDEITKRLELPKDFIPILVGQSARAFMHSHSNAPSGSKSICFLFKFGIYTPSYYQLAVHYSLSTHTTTALLLSKTADHQYPHLIQHLRSSPDLSTHPLYLPLLLSDLVITSSSKRLQVQNRRLSALEEEMGQHEYINRPLGNPLALDFVSTTRTLNAVGRVLAVETMRLKANLLTLEVIGVEAAKIQLAGSTRIEELVTAQKNASQNQLIRAETSEKRVQSQIAVVYQFMAQKDSKVNIALAETSALIARETRRDSEAMKTIAVLTMFFLPGTFLAAVFAMPLFDWDGGDAPVVKDAFKYYWSIAIPLTAAVFALWSVSVWAPWRGRNVTWWIVESKRAQKVGDEVE